MYYISLDNFNIFPSDSFTLRTAGRPKHHLKKNYDRFSFGFKTDSVSHVTLRYGTDRIAIQIIIRFISKIKKHFVKFVKE